ncbi:hypothetical protein [Lysobacter sp. CFH 32150]|uniref:hypothetical protein n=1 Tax=Lysobacter sp. CFH 32150 TaxID=2927128 RepID=UPI001FA6D9FA|nr:hypothetical protein [Lysobacter sp. CFH 32150]MCI4566388.1 hypothetical protein [Lysobacter sp. CFH 32150]
MAAQIIPFPRRVRPLDASARSLRALLLAQSGVRALPASGRSPIEDATQLVQREFPTMPSDEIEAYARRLVRMREILDEATPRGRT